jgi:predicted Zn-dependent protease
METLSNDNRNCWRYRAQEIRAIGDRMHDELARQEMMRLASKYERLAEWAEQRDLPAAL